MSEEDRAKMRRSQDCIRFELDRSRQFGQKSVLTQSWTKLRGGRLSLGEKEEAERRHPQRPPPASPPWSEAQLGRRDARTDISHRAVKKEANE